MARWKPYALPSIERPVESAMMASRGEVLTPFPTLSVNLAPSTCAHDEAAARRGRLAVEVAYPAAMRSFLLPSLSESHPDTILRKEAVLSATPSITPTVVLLVPMTPVRKSGTSG